ncbi:MAG: ribonucleoside triphosphate reductase [Chloroflexota bacterium]|nr:MAG: ribonucleoside triphosphate reductase [Chloroflexota bacterium]
MHTIQQVRKRDGRIVPFDPSRIENAVSKAIIAVHGKADPATARLVTERVVRQLQLSQDDAGHIPDVEQIQDVVEQVLIQAADAQVAKAYILYREQRAQVRRTERLMLDGIKLMDDYLERSDWRVNENSNMNYSLQGLNFYLASSVSARYWLHKIYPPEVRRAHTAGDFHIHDLSVLAAYCCGWDLQDLLLRGFGGVTAKVESRPPRHLRSALGQVVNFFYTLQGEAAGAQALSNFDTLLAPFVRYDGLDYRGVKQAIQEFIFNVNVPTRVGFQTPFTNLTMDLVPPATLCDQSVIIGGEPQRATYGEFQAEMDMLNRAFAEVMLDGDARGRVFTFPIVTYNITPDFDWDNPALEPIWRMTARYGVPYFANFINSDLSPEDARSMCCRLRLDNRELRRRGGGLFGANPLTGSIGVVTINLPRVGYLSRTTDELLDRLARLMDVARVSLEIKRKALERLTRQGLYPYSRNYLDGVYRHFGQYWANHFSTIGINGMHELCLNFLGVGIEHPEGKALAVRILHFMRERLAAYQEETGNLYNLEATPAEGASFRLAKADKARYPDIYVSGTDDNPYYTNSTHLPVDYTDDLFVALEHQDDLQVLYTGGTVLHAFLGEQINDWRQARLLVRRIAENYRLPYYTLTPTFSIGPVHGYVPGRHTYCPREHSAADLARFGVPADQISDLTAVECTGVTEGSTKKIPCEVYSRVVGYLRPVRNWHQGKRQEFEDRRVYRLDVEQRLQEDHG